MWECFEGDEQNLRINLGLYWEPVKMFEDQRCQVTKILTKVTKYKYFVTLLNFGYLYFIFMPTFYF